MTVASMVESGETRVGRARACVVTIVHDRLKTSRVGFEASKCKGVGLDTRRVYSVNSKNELINNQQLCSIASATSKNRERSYAVMFVNKWVGL